MQFLHYNLPELIKAIGYLGIFGFIFAESGLLIGFFLPGDSLLFTAGILASQGFLNIWILALGTWCFAVLGDSVGYWFGHRVGRKLFEREDSRFFKKAHLLHAQEYFDKHGRKTIILARFIPIVRTFAPIIAGIGSMQYRIFLSYNIIGGTIWGLGVPLVGYFLGNAIPNIDHYLIPIIAGIILVSLIPPLIEIVKARRI